VVHFVGEGRDVVHRHTCGSEAPWQAGTFATTAPAPPCRRSKTDGGGGGADFGAAGQRAQPLGPGGRAMRNCREKR
jgi:hypothetical protein